MKPFVKWAGGKSQLLKEIKKRYPVELGKVINKYAEPFVGGGAVFFDVLENYQLESFYISDINKELINSYLVIKNQINSLVNLLYNFQKEFLSASQEQRKKLFYQKRQEFNSLKEKNKNNSFFSQSNF